MSPRFLLLVTGMLLLSSILYFIIDNYSFKAYSQLENQYNQSQNIKYSNSSGYPDFNFAAAGDFGCGPNAQKTVSNMVSKKPEIVIALGDLSYKKKADCWFSTVAPLDTGNKFKIAIGLHDIERNLTKYVEYMKHFNLTKPYYSFDFQNVHFLAMSTARNTIIPYLLGSDQYNFVNADLDSASKNKNIDWIVVYSFRSFYSSNTTHPGLDELQDIYHPLFEKYGVDVVLQAHNHNYQRTYPLAYNPKNPSKPIIINNETEEYRGSQKGPIFVTAGTGGEPLYNFTGKKPFVIEQLTRNGFVNVDITHGGSNLTATFYANERMEALDRFTILMQRK